MVFPFLELDELKSSRTCLCLPISIPFLVAGYLVPFCSNCSLFALRLRRAARFVAIRFVFMARRCSVLIATGLFMES